jgi:hypothetical protein
MQPIRWRAALVAPSSKGSGSWSHVEAIPGWDETRSTPRPAISFPVREHPQVGRGLT